MNFFTHKRINSLKTINSVVSSCLQLTSWSWECCCKWRSAMIRVRKAIPVVDFDERERGKIRSKKISKKSKGEMNLWTRGKMVGNKIQKIFRRWEVTWSLTQIERVREKEESRTQKVLFDLPAAEWDLPLRTNQVCKKKSWVGRGWVKE